MPPCGPSSCAGSSRSTVCPPRRVACARRSGRTTRPSRRRISDGRGSLSRRPRRRRCPCANGCAGDGRRLSRRLESLPPFWLAFTLTLTETVGGGVLALPIAFAGFGPAGAIVLLVVFGVLNMLTVAALVESITRDGRMRYGNSYLGRLIGDYLGRPGLAILVPTLFILDAVGFSVALIGFGTTLAGVTGLSVLVWAAALFAVVVVILWRGSLDATVAVAVAVGSINLLLLLVDLGDRLRKRATGRPDGGGHQPADLRCLDPGADLRRGSCRVLRPHIGRARRQGRPRPRPERAAPPGGQRGRDAGRDGDLHRLRPGRHRRGRSERARRLRRHCADTAGSTRRADHRCPRDRVHRPRCRPQRGLSRARGLQPDLRHPDRRAQRAAGPPARPRAACREGRGLRGRSRSPAGHLPRRGGAPRPRLDLVHGTAQPGRHADPAAPGRRLPDAPARRRTSPRRSACPAG